MNEELQDDNYEDCSYLEFDNNFPINNNNDKNEKNKKIFKIIQYCYINGKPPPQYNNTIKSIKSIKLKKNW